MWGGTRGARYGRSAMAVGACAEFQKSESKAWAKYPAQEGPRGDVEVGISSVAPHTSWRGIQNKVGEDPKAWADERVGIK